MKRVIIIVAIVLAVWGIMVTMYASTRKYPGVYLRTDAIALRDEFEDWKSKGGSLNDWKVPSGPPGVLFVYTNTVTFSNTVHHCCFAERRPHPPEGLLAITDDGVIIWIRDRDGKITVAPEWNGVDY